VIIVLGPTASADWLGDWLVPVIIGVLGLIGVAVGGWLASGSALRIRLMDMTQRQAESQRDFQIRTVTAVNALGIAMGLAMDYREDALTRILRENIERAQAAGVRTGTIEVTGQLVIDPDLLERVRAATEAWRSVLAEAQAFSDSAMSAAFVEFDNQREKVVKTSNSATDVEGMRRASKEADVLRNQCGPQIYRVLMVEQAKGSWRMYQLAHIRRIRALARQISTAVAAEIVKGEQLIATNRPRPADASGQESA
jgi:hypothetical protein